MENTQPQRKNYSSKNTDVVTLAKGKIQPQAIDLEEAVIGAMMIDKKGLDEVIDILSPKVFYKESHQKIFSAIFSLFEKTEPIDILTVSNELKLAGDLDKIGGDYYLVHLSQKVSTSAHIAYHSRILTQKHIQRELIRVSAEITKDAYDETIDVLELIDSSENKLFDITNGSFNKGAETAQSLVHQAIEKIQEMGNKEGLSGVPSGFKKLDQVTNGWHPADLVILAARPGMGKTAFVLSMAKNMAIKHNTPVAIFSLEMANIQLITRLISSETGISSEKLKKGNLADHEWQQLNTKVKALENAPIFIDDTPALSIFDLRAKCRRLKSQFDIKIIIIDYLQLMTAGGKGGNREQEISMISRNLKAIAKELNVPVIALSQLSRAVETRGGNKRPMLSDLRESGAIEQDADIVSFIYRPEYYGITEWEDGTPTDGQGELIIAKHRNGSLEDVRLKFIGAQITFADLDEDFAGGEFESSINDNISGDPNSAFVNPSNNDEFNPFDDSPF
ncbi:MAG: replicative DNA helicase [Ichthyobacteriaceae bacterium]|nr:replicative DNA helicase [Ichthyobacteriaceae bacterium]